MLTRATLVVLQKPAVPALRLANRVDHAVPGGEGSFPGVGDNTSPGTPICWTSHLGAPAQRFSHPNRKHILLQGLCAVDGVRSGKMVGGVDGSTSQRTLGRWPSTCSTALPPSSHAARVIGRCQHSGSRMVRRAIGVWDQRCRDAWNVVILANRPRVAWFHQPADAGPFADSLEYGTVRRLPMRPESSFDPKTRDPARCDVPSGLGPTNCTRCMSSASGPGSLPSGA